MSYLDDLIGTNKQPSVNVVQAQPTQQISGVVQAQPESISGVVNKPTAGAVSYAPKQQTASMPKTQIPQADNLGLQRDDGISTDTTLQPAGGEQDTKLNQLFKPKVTGAYGSDTPEDMFKNYDAMSPLEKAHYAQKYSETATSDLVFGKEGRNPLQKVAGFAMDLVDPLVRDAANIRLTNRLSDEVARGNVDQSVFDGIEVLNKSNVQIVGDVAQAVLTAYTPSIGVNLVSKSLVQQGLKQLALAGLKEGSFAGLQYGIAQAMSSGSTDPKEIAKIIGLNTVMGGAGGAILSTVIPAISKVISGTKQIISENTEKLVKYGFSQAEAKQMTAQGGFLGDIFKSPKVKELTSQLEKSEALKQTALRNGQTAVAARYTKNIESLNKQIRQEMQGGFVKNPFAKEEMPGNKSGVKFEIPETKNPDSFYKSLKKTLNPINYTDDTTKKVYNNYTRNITKAAESANQTAAQFKDIANKDGWEAILDYEKGVANKHGVRIQQTFDDLHKQALEKGLDIPYRENYTPQIYKNTPEEIKLAVGNYLVDQGVDHKIVQEYINGIAELPSEVASRLKMTPNFAKARVLPDYQTALEYGLQPKYTHPGQLAGAYQQELERAVAGRELVQDLVATGKLVSAKSAPGDFQAVNLPFSSKGYYADPTLAKVLNGQFQNETKSFGEKLAAGMAKVSKTSQEITLSGGLPNTDVNFFALGQVIKNVTAGDVKAIPAFVRANFDDASLKFFEKKAPVIKQMAQHGIDLSQRVGKLADMYDNMVASPTVSEAFGKGWHRTFERKTFASLMPQLQINTFESAYKGALKKGLSDIEAGEVAAKTVKAFYGLLENTGRSKTTQDTLSSLFFAPKFREGIIRTLWNTGKSLTTEIKNPAFAMNRKLAAGMAISYTAYNAANKALNGKWMWENEPGKEFDLRVPLSNGKIAYVGFMPSFLSLPKSAISGTKALVTGDFKTAKQKGSAFLSQPVQLLTQLANNRDYYGNSIYNDNDSTSQKMKDIALYFGPSVSHPYMKLVKDVMFPNPEFPKPLVQSIMEASELPVKFSTLEQISRQQFYKGIDDKAKTNKAEIQSLKPTYDKVQELKKQGKEDEAQTMVDNLSDEDYKTYTKIKASDKRRETTGAEAKMYTTYQKVQELKKQGKEEEAQNIVDEMSDEDYRIYSLVRDRFKTEE